MKPTDVPSCTCGQPRTWATVSICKACIKHAGDQARQSRTDGQEASRARNRVSRLKAYWRNPEKSRRLARAWARTQKARAINRRAVERYRAKNPHKIAAAKAVNLAIRRGAISRPPRCEALRCGRRPRHAHHNSYHPRRRLKVAHLCLHHHEHSHHRGPVRLRKGAAFQYAQAPQEIRA